MNTILGCIPAGRESRSIPVKSISACIIDRSYDLQALIVGFIMLPTGVGSVAGHFPILAIILLILGLSMVLGSIRTVICIQNNGTEMAVFIPFYASQKAYDIKKMIDAAIGSDTSRPA